jgi:hypothetical protein
LEDGESAEALTIQRCSDKLCPHYEKAQEGYLAFILGLWYNKNRWNRNLTTHEKVPT